MRKQLYWIKERRNPQSGTYYVLMGILSGREAKRNCMTIYGTNIMHAFSSLSDYEAEIARLKQVGATVHP